MRGAGAALRRGLPAALLLWATGLPAAPLAAQARGTSAIVDVAVVRVEHGDVLRRQTVVVRDGHIDEIGPVEEVAVPRGATRIEGSLRFLVPGLIELDGYLPHPDDGYRTEDVLLMYVARGVTAVRALQTHPSQTALEGRVEGGNPVGPQLFLVEAGGAGEDGAGTRGASSQRQRQRQDQDQAQGEGDGGWAAERARLPDRFPRLPSGDRSPPEVLRALTLDAARSLGTHAESGRIEVGGRADLLLLDANPLEATENLARVHGVMVHGRWLPHADTERRVENRAKDLVLGYYRTIPPEGVSAPGCRGATLQDCFGGDSDCWIGQPCRADYLPPRRAELLDQLDLLGRIVPGNGWVAGQRVSFALKNDDLERAEAAAESCRAALWWCQALRGYVSHHRVQGSGEPQLDSALANAPSAALAWAEPRVPSAGDRGVHCEWTDIGTLVSGMMASQLRQLGCGFEGTFQRRFWWLADPLWSVPGNERRSEHIVRNIQMRFHDEILRLRRSHHPQEHHVRVLPAGVPNSWQPVTSLGRRGGTGAPQVIESRGGYVNGGYSFTPDERRFYNPAETTSDDWALTWDKGREVQVQASGMRAALRLDERMVTPERWYSLEHQTAVLRREGNLLVLAAARPPLLLPSFSGVSATLAMGRPADLRVEVTPALIEPSGVMRASTELEAPRPDAEPASPLWGASDVEWLASIELVGEDFRGRARHGAPAPPLVDGFGLSDLVLVSERFERDRLPLLDAMLPSPVLAGTASIGVYFEVYGIRPEEPLQIAISGERTNLSLMERLTGALRLRTEASLEVAWLEAAETPTPNTMQRHLTVDLSGLDDGDYELVVTVARGDGTTATAARIIRVGRR